MLELEFLLTLSMRREVEGGESVQEISRAFSSQLSPNSGAKGWSGLSGAQTQLLHPHKGASCIQAPTWLFPEVIIAQVVVGAWERGIRTLKSLQVELVNLGGEDHFRNPRVFAQNSPGLCIEVEGRKICPAGWGGFCAV